MFKRFFSKPEVNTSQYKEVKAQPGAQEVRPSGTQATDLFRGGETARLQAQNKTTPPKNSYGATK